MHWKSPQSPRKKKAHEQVEIQNYDDFFDILGLSTLIGCLKNRLSHVCYKNVWRPFVNVCDEGHQTSRRMPRGSFATTRRQPTTLYLWSVIWRKTTLQRWNITMRLLCLPESHVYAQRNQVWVRACNETKSEGAQSHDPLLTLITARLTAAHEWNFCAAVESSPHANAPPCSSS